MKLDLRQLIKAGSTSIINALGASIFSFALALKLLKVTGSAFGYGTSLFIGPIVGLLIAPIIGRIIDHYDHKKLALIAESLLITTLTAYFFVYTFLKSNILYTAIVVVTLINIFGRLFSITYLSSTPQIVSQKSIQRLNSIQTTGVAMAGIVATPLAGFLYGIIDFKWLILVEIVTETLTLLITWWTNFDIKTPSTSKEADVKDINLIKILKQQRPLVVLITIAMCLNLSYISLQIGVPYVLIHVLKYSTAVSGNVQGVLSFGVFLGGIAITTFNVKNVFHFEKITFMASITELLTLGILIKLLPIYTLIIFVVIEFIEGIVESISNPPAFTYVQEVIPKYALGRINTLMFTVTQILNPIGVLIYSTAFAKVNYQTIYLVNGIITAIVVGLLFTQFKGKKMVSIN